MNTTKPLKVNDISVSKIHIDPLKKKTYKSGQETKQCRIAYDYGNNIKKEFTMRTPIATVPYGLSIAKEMEGETPRKFKKYSLDFEVNGTPELEMFRDKMIEFDNKNIDFITKNATEWWNKTPSGKPWDRDMIQNMSYSSVLKKTAEEKGDYPERFKVKLPFYEGIPRFVVYDHNNNKIDWVSQKNGETILDWSWAKKGMKMETITQCEALWEVNKKVYCTFRAQQIKVYPPDGLRENEFLDSDTEDETSQENTTNVSASAVEIDSDSEPEKVVVEEETDESESEPETDDE